MRILLVNKFDYHRGGAERAFLDQERWLREAGHSLAVLSQGEPSSSHSDDRELVTPATFDAGALRALPHVGRMFWSREVYDATSRLIARFRPQVALIHNAYHQLGPATLLALARRRVPIVMVLHDQKLVCPAYSGLRQGEACSECAGQRFTNAARHGCGGSSLKGALLAAESYWQWRILRTYQRASALLAPSDYLRGRLADMGLEQPVTLLRNGVQPEAGPFVPLGERPHVGFAGRLSSEKGAHLLLDAARQLPLLRFRLAGKGPDETTLRRRIEQEKLANVQLLGHLDQDSLRREMRTWRLAVVPSIMYENCPYAALDAMACQVPVIGADAGGLRELAAWSGISFKRGSAADLARTIDASFHRLSELEHHVSAGTRFVHDECSPERHVRSLVGVLSRSLP